MAPEAKLETEVIMNFLQKSTADLPTSMEEMQQNVDQSECWRSNDSAASEQKEGFARIRLADIQPVIRYVKTLLLAGILPIKKKRI